MIIIGFLAIYAGMLRRNVSEKARRSLQLRDEVTDADHVLVSIAVTSVDPAKGQLTARLRFQPFGDIARDSAVPRVKLRFFVNNFPGQHLIEFSPGEGMTRIEGTFALEGDVNKYPFDRYETTIWLFMDTPRQSSDSPRSQIPQVSPDEEDQLSSMALGVSEIQSNLRVPLSISISASTPGMQYTGQVIRTKEFNATRVRLNLRRPSNLMNTAIAVMCLMMGLALTVLGMVTMAMSSREKFDFLPISMAISLIFGLPALRNIQPGVPPVGVLGDYFSFIWAELIVAASAIIAGWTWVVRLVKRSKSTLES